jgi:hypothetical protein
MTHISTSFGEVGIMVLTTETNMMSITPTGARPLHHHKHNSDETILNKDMIIEIIVIQVATKSACFAV